MATGTIDEQKNEVAKVATAAVLATATVMLPLAATSTQRMMRRMGRRWGQLHRLIYLIAVLAILHFWWMRAGKNR